MDGRSYDPMALWRSESGGLALVQPESVFTWILFVARAKKSKILEIYVIIRIECAEAM